MEQQQQSEAELAREKVEELESALDDEKRKRDACEQQIQQQLQVWTTKLSFENGKYFYSKINFFHLLALNSLTSKYDKIMIHTRALLFPTLHDSTAGRGPSCSKLG